MKITILPQGTLAIYEQIVNQLKNAVVTGELKAGEALPSIRALAADLGVSVITTKRAYEELEKEGLVRSVAGKGFYVCEYNADYLKEKHLVLLEKRLNRQGLAKKILWKWCRHYTNSRLQIRKCLCSGGRRHQVSAIY